MTIVMLNTSFSSEVDGTSKPQSAADIFESFIMAFVVPLIACVCLVVAWPLALRKWVKDLRESKNLPPSGNAGGPPVQEIHLFHPRINGKIVTGEEFRAAHRWNENWIQKIEGTRGSESVAAEVAQRVIKKAAESSRGAADESN